MAQAVNEALASARRPPESVGDAPPLRGPAWPVVVELVRLGTRAKPLADELLLAADSEAALDDVARRLRTDRARGYALLYACQLGARASVERPEAALRLSRRVASESEGFPPPVVAGGRTPLSRESLAGEAALLEAQALLTLGRADEARRVAAYARHSFERAGAGPFAAALTLYFEALAALAGGDADAAERHLRRALPGFFTLDQESWAGRVQAALAESFARRERTRRARATLEEALRRIDPNADADGYLSALVSKGELHERLDLLDDAAAAFALAEAVAVRHQDEAWRHEARRAAARVALRRGAFAEALARTAPLLVDAQARGREWSFLLGRLAAAEALGRLGRADEMAILIEQVDAESALGDAWPRTGAETLAALFRARRTGALDADAVAVARRALEELVRNRRRLDAPLGRFT